MSYLLFFDSGMGGLSVLREAIIQHPEENYIYVADNKNMPYGDRSLDEVRCFTLEIISVITKKFDIRAITVACNTATSAAINDLRAIYKNMPVIGIEPAIKPAAKRFPGKRIGVMATQMTLREKKFRDLLARYADDAEITPIPCPGLVDFVENGILEGPELDVFLLDIFSKYDFKFDCLVLGCTHYPFVKAAIERASGCSNIIDGALGTVNNLFRQLGIPKNTEMPDFEKFGDIIFYNTKDILTFDYDARNLLYS